MSDKFNNAYELAGAYRFIRYSRTVLPAEALERLVAVVGHEATKVFGDKGAVRKRIAPFPPARPDRRSGGSDIIGIPAVSMYSANDLSLTQLEIRVSELAITKHAQWRRLHTKSEDIIKSVPFHNQELAVATSRLLFRSHQWRNGKGEEIMLELDPTSDAIIIDETNGLLERSVLLRGAGKALEDNLQPLAVAIAIGQLPFAKADDHDRYEARKVELQQAVQPYLPLLGIELCPITPSSGTNQL